MTRHYTSHLYRISARLIHPATRGAWLLTVFLVLQLSCAAIAAEDNVRVVEDQTGFTLENGVISARVSKQSGNLVSLTYQHVEMLDQGFGGSSGGYWSHDVSRERRVACVTIDPKTNGGQRAEVSIKGFFDGRVLARPGGGIVTADIEMRYALARGDSALYAYCIFSHPTNYAATSVGEARFCAKLNDAIFDWMTVDSNRNMEAITAYDWDHGTVLNFDEARRMNTGTYQGGVEHKYDYAADQFNTPAWGWSSSAHNIGIWFINPSVEYLSGGPTKVELCAHRDCTFTDDLNAPAPPCLLNYWRSSHYGGSICSIAQGEAWTKVIGPFLIYCNAAAGHDAMWKDALERAGRESAAWPYHWVNGIDYPHRHERGTVSGQLALHDPQAPGLQASNYLVGLSAPAYVAPVVFNRFRNFNPPAGAMGGETAGANGMRSSPETNSYPFWNSEENRRRFLFRRGMFGPQGVDWQNDAKHYEFWVRGAADGSFSIPNVRPGEYTLHAIADGVLGEFVLSNVTVTAGGKLDLGKLAWQPVRYGQQLWDIGIPNRTAGEFFEGNDYYHWGWYVQYPRLFPHDVNYVIGKSDFRKDWFFEQVPHDEDLSDTNAAEPGRSTTWSIAFNLGAPPGGTAILRLAICGVGTRQIAVNVNGQSAGRVTNLVYNATINRDGIEGSWSEHDLSFDATLMKAGSNVLTLTIPGGSLTSGVMYDYLRLELNSGQPCAARGQEQTARN